MVTPFRHLLLKTLAVALVAGGNCWACPLTTPVAQAAGHHEVPAVTQCLEVVAATVSIASVPMSEDGGCPMSDHESGSAPASNETTRPLATQFATDGLTTAEAFSQLSPVELIVTSFSDGRLHVSDRSSPLTGIIVKNE